MSGASRDRLSVVLRLRTLTERRRLAEAADAARVTAAAAQVHQEGLQRQRQQVADAPDVATPPQLVTRRLQGIGLADDVAQARSQYLTAAREEYKAADRRMQAGIRRRSVERLSERRATQAAREASRRSELQLDAAALELWRRQR